MSSRGLWPALPDTVLGRRIPRRLRRRFVDPDWLLCELVDWLEREAPPDRAPRREVAAPREPAPAPRREDGRARDERQTLVRLCIDLRERLDSPALDDRVRRALDEAGVTAESCDGEPFDAERHAAVARVDTADPSLHNTVAETDRPVYLDRGEVIEPARVSVYRLRR